MDIFHDDGAIAHLFPGPIDHVCIRVQTNFFMVPQVNVGAMVLVLAAVSVSYGVFPVAITPIIVVVAVNVVDNAFLALRRRELRLSSAAVADISTHGRIREECKPARTIISIRP